MTVEAKAYQGELRLFPNLSKSCERMIESLSRGTKTVSQLTELGPMMPSKLIKGN